MKSLALEINRNEVTDRSRWRVPAREKVGAYVELTKPRITTLIVLTAAAGYCLATTGAFNFGKLFHTLFGIALLSSGIATFNQYIERELDARMKRTALRPLPSGKITAKRAFAFGLGLTMFAEGYLAWFVNPLTALLGVTVIIGYVLVYTPLKTRTTLSTVLGAFPGAMPPLMGWTAASNSLEMGGLALFAILFLWQFPHFLAIALMYREEYSRAGILMLPVVDGDGRLTGQQIVIYAVMLLPVSLLPTLLGIAGSLYFFGAVLLGVALLYFSIATAFTRSREQARRLLLASVLYLPLLFLLMVFNH